MPPKSFKITIVFLSIILFFFAGVGVASAAPDITFSNLTVTAIKDTSVVIQWDTDIAATGKIEYGQTTSYGNLTEEESFSYWHSVKVIGLIGGTTYHFRIRAKDIDGNETISGDYTFTTRTQAELETIVKAARKNGDLPKTYYVKTDGNDANDGLTIATAWQRPSYAAQQAQAGDTLYLVDGTWYNEHVVFANSGNATHPITLTIYNGTPTLDGVDDTGYGIQITNKDYIDITGNILIKNYYRGIYADGSPNHINIKDVTITSTPGFSIHFYPGSEHITIDNVNITDNEGTGGAIVFQGFSAVSSYITIKNSNFENNRHNAINIHTNIHHVLIENNIIFRATNAAGVMVHNYYCKNITIRNNTIVDSTRGIQLYGVDGCLVENNTVLNSYASYGIVLSTYSDVRSVVQNATIRNNVVKNSSLYDVYIASYEADVAISDILFENNSIEKVFRFEGNNISNFTVRNIADATRTFSIKNAVSNLKIEFTDGRTFKLNGDAGGHTNVTLTGVGTYTIEVETVTATISGTVKDTSNNSIQGATVSDGTRSVTTNATGNYTISNVPAGTYTVTASKTGYQSVSQSGVVVNQDATTTVNFVLTSTPTPLKGDLNSDGKVNSLDYSLLVAKWFQTTGITLQDLNKDGKVNVRDLGIMMSNWKE